MRDEKWFLDRKDKRRDIRDQMEKVKGLQDQVMSMIEKRQGQLSRADSNDILAAKGQPYPTIDLPIVKRSVIERYFLVLQDEQRKLRKLLQQQRD